MAVNQNPALLRAPPPPVTYSFVAACCYIPLSRMIGAGMRCRYAPHENLAKVLVASQEILLETYVAEWPPKPVTNSMFLIHSHMSTA